MSKTKKQHPGNIYDAFVKLMFSRVLVFADFLVNYADPKFVAKIDLRNITLAPTHYFGKKGDERIVDLVFLCPLKNGKGTMMVVIIFEHQGGSLRFMPFKLHKNISAIWDAEIKAGKKILSSPYFIVLRTGKRPHRGPYPQMVDSLSTDGLGNRVGHAFEIIYDVVDLPARDFKKLTGGPVLRLSMGVLKKMTEGTDLEFPEALLPLLEISDGDFQIELTKESFDFIAKVFAAHNLRLDADMVHNALKPIFQDKEHFMIATIFEEKFLEGVAEGEARGEARGEAKVLVEKASTVLTVLQARFKKVPKSVERSVRQVKDKVALDSLAARAATCGALKEFAENLN